MRTHRSVPASGIASAADHTGMVRALLLAVFALACSAEGVRTDHTIVVVPEALVAPAEPQADVVLSPTPGTDPAFVELAAARWSAATGMRIVVAPGGVPVTVADADVFSPRGQVCALTETSVVDGPLSVDVDTTPPAGHGCRGAKESVTHEIGHVICRTFAPVDGDCHADSGVMTTAARGNNTIDSQTLEAVCAFAPCTTFTPES